MQYQVISYSNGDKLSKRVNELLNNGWLLYGPLSTSPTRWSNSYGQTINGTFYTQAMYLPDEEKTTNAWDEQLAKTSK